MGVDGVTKRLAPGFPVKGFLIPEMVVDSRYICSRPFADFCYSGASVAHFREHLACRFQQTFAGSGTALPHYLHTSSDSIHNK
jgi:hypothetical protein